MFIPKKYALIGFYLGLFLLLASVVSSAQTFICSPCAVSVNGTNALTTAHGSPYPSTLNVSGVVGTINTITVQLNGLSARGSGSGSPQGESTATLGVMLESPDGRFLEVLGNPGNTAQTLTSVNIPITDAGPNVMPNQSSGTWSGTSGTLVSYYPTSYTNGTYAQNYSSPGPGAPTSVQLAAHGSSGYGTGTLNGVFGGANPNGNWNLLLIDSAGTSNDNISITGWQITITVNASNTATTTTISSNLNPSWTTSPNNSVTLTATVTGTPTPSGGTVAFKDGASTIAGCSAQPLSGSQATCTTTFATEGNHSLTAVYSGSGTFNGSTSSALNQFVKKHSEIVSGQYCNTGGLSVPGNTNPIPDPSIINVGTDTTAIANAVSTVAVAINSLSADQAGAIRFLLVAPSGQAMEFWGWSGDFTPTSGSFFISDSASTPLPASGTLTAGTYEPAVYVQGDTFLSGPAPAPQAPGSFSVAAPAGNPTPASFLSTFNGATADGDWKLFAYYNGGSGHTLTVGNWCLDITPGTGAATVTTVNSTENPSRTGDSITITALVTSASNPVTSGTVTFTENGVAVAGTAGTPVAVDGSGMASVVTNALPEGDHTIKATYNPSSSSFNLSFDTYVQRVDRGTFLSVLSANIYSYCNFGQITIPGPNNASNIGPASPNPSDIFVTNGPGTINKATWTLKNYHVPADDVSTLLVGPGATNGQTLDLFSGIANGVPFGPVTITLDDAASSSLSNSSAPASGTYKPTSYTSNDTFFASLSGFIPFPAGPYQYAAPSGSTTLGLFNNQDPNGLWSLYFNQTTHASGGGVTDGWCMTLTVNPPVLTISKNHVGDFTLGQTDAQYTITVHNNGPGKTGSDGGPVVVTDTLPTGLTATAASGTGWTCSTGATPSCNRSDALAAGADYPTITLTVTVGATTATPTVTNQASVSGGGAAQANTTNDTTILAPADLTIAKSHTGNFTQGQSGATFTITVTNQGPGSTNSAVNVQDTLPTGLTATAMGGSGWTCNFNTQFCTTSNVLAENTSYPDITLTVDVASNAPASVMNSVAVSGGGEVNTTNDTATDSVTVIPAPVLSVVKGHTGTFTQGQTAVWTITVSNVAASGTTSGTIAVTDTLPAGETFSSFTGSNWGCSGTTTVTCTSSQVVAGGSSFPTINLTVNIPANSPTSVSNTAGASGGGAPISATSSPDTVSVVQVPSTVSINSSSSQSTAINSAFGSLAVTVKDAAGAVIPNYSSVTFTAPLGPGATGTFSTSTNTKSISTNGAGVADPGTFTANSTAGGPYSLTVTAGSASTNFSLTNNPGGANSITVTQGNGQSATVSNAFGTLLQALVKDSGNNPVPNVAVTFTAPSTGASGHFANNTNTTIVNTDANGLATATTFTANTTAGTYSVTAAAAGDGSTNLSLTNNPGTATTISATAGSGQSAQINNAFATLLKATVTDTYNNPVPNVSVTFTAPGSGASGKFANNTITTSANTDSSGVATATTFTANSTAGGPYIVGASTAGVGTPANFSLTNTPGGAASITVTQGSGQSTAVHSAFGTLLQAIVKDSSNNPVPGVSVTFTAPGSGASGTFANNTATTIVNTDTNGLATATTFTANTAAGSYSVTASAAGDGSTSFSLTNDPGNATSITPTAGSGQSAQINSAFATLLKATVSDTYGNPVPSVSVTFTAPASGASGHFANNTITTSANTDSSGVATATTFTANSVAGGPYTVAATTAGVGTPANFSLTNTSGGAASITVTQGSGQSAQINMQFGTLLQALVKDSGNNPVPNVSVTFTAPNTGASGLFANNAITTTTLTDANGLATATTFTANSTAGGPYLVTAAAAGDGSTTFSLTNLHGNPNSITASAGSGQSANLNTAFATALKAVVKDSGNNPVPGVNVTFTAPGSGASGTFPGPLTSATVATDATGTATAPTFTANGTTGGYMVSASTAGVGTPASFSLTNINPVIIMVTPNSLNFGDVNLGSKKDLTLTVKNVSSSNMKITNITFNYGPGSGKDYGYFTQCGGTIKPGKTCIITVELRAQDLGPGVAILNIFYNGVGSPVQVGLMGTVINPKARLNKSSLNFGDVKVGHSSTSSVTLTGSGDTALMLNSITISGSSDFTESDNCPVGGSLSPNTNCTINVSFAPSARRSRSGTLKISDNASSSPQTVSLSGEGN